MITDLYNIVKETSYDWDQWVRNFDQFIGHKPRDPDDKLFQYKHFPDYCIWKQDDDNIYTISYRYVNHLDSQANMRCLQSYSPDKEQALINYKKIYKPNSIFPSLVEYYIVEDLIYTHFKGSSLGYPGAFSLFNVMMTSYNVVDDFKIYVKRIVDNYHTLYSLCKENKISYFKPRHILVSHLAENDLWYFRDTVFFYTDKNLTVEDLAKSISDTIDGFRRAQGIIDAYSNRKDSSKETREKLFEAIEELKEYAENKCLSLENVSLS